MTDLKKDSGQVTSNNKLTSFLYELMRDEIPPGKIEQLVQNSEQIGETVYTNGWLALYAEYLAKRLQAN